MLSAAILSGLVAIVAGMRIQIWAFLCCAIPVAFAAGVLLSSGGFWSAVLVVIAFLAMMQIAYVLGAFLSLGLRPVQERKPDRVEIAPVREAAYRHRR